jgi:hypothetical protein
MNPPFYKQPSEKYAIAVDYSNDLTSGETIASTLVTAIETYTGTTVTTTIIDSTAVTSTQAKAVVKAGTSGKQYKITVKSTSSLSYIYEDDLFMTVLDD